MEDGGVFGEELENGRGVSQALAGNERDNRNMTITLDIGPELGAELARQAADRGVGIDVYAASLLQEAAHAPRGAKNGAVSSEVAEACERLKTFGKERGLSLGGLSLRELRHEARP